MNGVGETHAGVTQRGIQALLRGGYKLELTGVGRDGEPCDEQRRGGKAGAIEREHGGRADNGREAPATAEATNCTRCAVDQETG